MNDENLCNCTNLLYNGFCFGWSVVFLLQRSFPCKCLCHLFFLVYFSILIDILPRLTSGFFLTSAIRAGDPLATKMLAVEFDVEKFDGIINFGS